MSDRELLQQYTTGTDRAALDALVRRYVHFVYATARRELGGDSHAADDVTQAVFLVLMRRAASVPADRVGGWLFRVTRYASADYRKRAGRRARHEREAAIQRAEVVNMAQASDANAAAQEADPLMPLLNDAIASLRGTDREAIIQRYFRGVEMADIAAGLGISEQTARKRITRAVERLRARFTARGAGAVAAPAVVGAIALAGAQTAPAATMAAVGSAMANAAAASSAAVSLCTGVTQMLLWLKVKLAAAVVMAVVLTAGAGVEVVRYATAGAAVSPSSTPALAAAPAAEAVAAATAATTMFAQWGPVIEVTIATQGQDNRLLDIDSNALLPLPRGVDLRRADTNLSASGADLGCEPTGNIMLFAFDLSAHVFNEWDDAEPGEFRVVQQASRLSHLGIPNGPTYAFVTREGTSCRLQILGLTPDGLGVRVRYQKLRAGASTTTQSAGPAQAVGVVRSFYEALAGADYATALALVTDKYPQASLEQMQQMLRVEQARPERAVVGQQQAVIITSVVEPRDPAQGRSGRWGVSLRRQEDGRWLIRDFDFLPDDAAVEQFVDGFRKSVPGAREQPVEQ